MSITSRPGLQAVYNLEIDLEHVYYVSTSALLVHNSYPNTPGKKAPSASAPAKRATGITVLGHYPEYVNVSEAMGARRFQIPESVWNRMTDAERWAANQKFLDRTIAHGDQIILATPAGNARPGSWFKRELEYHMGKGYRPSADGTRLIPPGAP